MRAGFVRNIPTIRRTKLPGAALTGVRAVQMQRAAVSIPANIAEGFRRRGHADKARFMNMADGPMEQCRYYSILAKDLGYGETSGLNDILEEVSRMLTAYTAIPASVS